MRKLALLTVATVAILPALSIAQTASTTAPATTEAATKASEDPNQRIRCRRVDVTGSLIKRGRVCRTVGEWNRQITNGNDTARDVVDYSRSRPAGD